METPNTLESVFRLNDFFKKEDENAEITSRQFKRDLKLYEQSFNLLMEITYFLYDKSTPQNPFSASKTAILLVLPRIIQLIQSIRILGLKGYYYDKLVLDRTFLESIGLCAYFTLNEKEARRWLSGKDVKPPKIELADYVTKLFSMEGISVKPLYGRLCNYVHTNLKGILSLVRELRPPQDAVMQFSPEFDKQKFYGISPYPVFMLILLAIMFRDNLAERQLRKISILSKRLEDIFGDDIKKQYTKNSQQM